MFPGTFGPAELIFVFVVVLLLFGAKRLPEIGSSLGKGIREFKSSVREIQSSVRSEANAASGPREPLASRNQDSADEEAEPRRLKTSAASGGSGDGAGSADG